MSLGWCTDLTDAKAYFTGERVITEDWDNATDALKTKGIIQAYNRIYYSKEYSVPTYAGASSSQLTILRKANCEMAIYILQHLEDEDKRKGIQAQGVIEAGIVKEKYDKDWLDKLPFPPIVDSILDDFKTAKSAFIWEIDRDEDLGADEDATIL